MKWLKFILIIFFMFTLVFGIANSSIVTTYITTTKLQNYSQSELKKAISDYASKYNVQPVEPKIDSIWKLIPGYNGLIVDEETTLRINRNLSPLENKKISIVWKEVETAKKIDDMGSYPIYRGNANKPAIAFMINVAWGTEYLDSILHTLNQEKVKATFFLDGSWIKQNEQMVRKIALEGHEIGNHAYSHPQMSKLSNERIRQEIIKTEGLIFAVTNRSSAFFAPPSGDYDQRVVDIAQALHLKTVLWTLDTIDWQKPTTDEIINRIVPKIGNGNLVLMHPTKSTAEALPDLIKKVKAKGLQILTVSETLSSKRTLLVEPLTKF